MAANEVRIIGGNWRGRKLSFPSAPGLRPSLGRVRETLFNWLRDEVADSRCLDLYAGSGALGFEALSRGAAEVTFVDRDPKVVKALQGNAARLNAQGCIIIRSVARKFLARAEAPWDIVFLDPPFAGGDLATTLDELQQRNLLSLRGLVYFEVSRRAKLELRGWTPVKESAVGESRFGLLAPAALPPTV
jgi:16S rRNA (guanine966-N2)-methyltransferase